jgi:tetratricopeptide (TPR) repeat protein
VADDIRAMTLEFARDPDGMVFLRLGEALRVRGDVEAATSVALAGLERYPDLPDARDLYARILVDADQPDQARQVWEGILEQDARHVGAHKGLGFLYYARGDIDASLDHLELALSADPTEGSVIQALHLVRSTAETLEDDPAQGVFEGLEGADQGLLLVDKAGRMLAGGLETMDGLSVADEIAAHLGGVSQEAVRCARLLELGEWQWLIAEGSEGNLHLTQPTPDTRLVVVRDRSVPPGRLTFLASRANEAARRWLDSQEL